MRFEQLNPIARLADLQNTKPAWVSEARESVETATVDELREMNCHWFSQHFGMKETVAMLWLVNLRLTGLGIAPAWRRGPPHIDLNARMPNPALPGGMQMLGNLRKKALMRRWIDLEWLRAVLGPEHHHNHRVWRHAFAADPQVAETAWGRINQVCSTGGSSFGVEGAYMVVTRLKVPMLHRVALTGLIDKNTAKRRATAQQRLRDDVGPRLEGLMCRARHPLTPTQFEHRMRVSEAIELGQGVPAASALIFKWITGCSITPQSIQVMREKIADQCQLTRMYWCRKRAAPALPTLLLSGEEYGFQPPAPARRRVKSLMENKKIKPCLSEVTDSWALMSID